MNQKIVTTYTDDEATVQSEVKLTNKGYSVVLRDIDSNMVLPVIKFFALREAAEAYAKKLVGR